MRCFIFILIIIFSQTVYSSEIDVKNIWEKDILIDLKNELENKDNKSFNDFIMLTKVFYQLTFLEYEKNGNIFTEELRNEDEKKPGYLNTALFYAKQAENIKKNDLELNYYLSKIYLNLISGPSTFFKYSDGMKNHFKRLETIDNESIYYLMFAVYFHGTYNERAGAKRKIAENMVSKLVQQYPDDISVLNLLSFYFYKNNKFSESEKYCRMVLEKKSDNLENLNRLKNIDILRKKMIIQDVKFKNTGGLNNAVLEKFIKIKKNQILTPLIINKIKKDLMQYRLILNVIISFQELENNKVIIYLDIKSDVKEIYNIGMGYEYVIDWGKNDDVKKFIKGIIPPLFYYSNNDFYNNGLFNFNFISVCGFLWNPVMTINFLEKIDLTAGIKIWDFPVFHTINDNSSGWKNIAEINYLYIEPEIEISKFINKYKIKFGINYLPKIYFILSDSYFTEIDNPDNYVLPPEIFCEHKIKIFFNMDFINLLEFGWVREGFKFDFSLQWIKQTPDFVWSYDDFYSYPENYSFKFNFYFEFSKLIKNLFYFSLGVHYTGGINLYKINRITVGKEAIGTPFDYGIKVHGFEREAYFADHVFLINTLFGFKINKHFHLGVYIDACNFFERSAENYLVKIINSDFSNNMILGFGSFFKITPGWMFDIFIEASFGYDAGGQKIHGPVFGLYLSKTFMK